MVSSKVCKEREIAWIIGRWKVFSGDSKQNVILAKGLKPLPNNERIQVKLKGLSPVETELSP